MPTEPVRPDRNRGTAYAAWLSTWGPYMAIALLYCAHTA